MAISGNIVLEGFSTPEVDEIQKTNSGGGDNRFPGTLEIPKIGAILPAQLTIMQPQNGKCTENAGKSFKFRKIRAALSMARWLRSN